MESSVCEEVFGPVEKPCRKAHMSQFIDYTLVGGFVKGFFEVKHNKACLLFFVEAFCDILIKSGYVVLAAFLLPEAGLAWWEFWIRPLIIFSNHLLMQFIREMGR